MTFRCVETPRSLTFCASFHPLSPFLIPLLSPQFFPAWKVLVTNSNVCRCVCRGRGKGVVIQQATLQHQQGVLQFNSILTLSTWRYSVRICSLRAHSYKTAPASPHTQTSDTTASSGYCAEHAHRLQKAWKPALLAFLTPIVDKPMLQLSIPILHETITQSFSSPWLDIMGYKVCSMVLRQGGQLAFKAH